VAAFKNAPVFFLPSGNLALKSLQFRDILKNLNASRNSAVSVSKSGSGTYDRDLFAFNVFDHILSVVDIASVGDGPLEGTVRFADSVLEHVLAIHTHRIVGGKTRDLLCGRIKEGDAIFLVRGEKTIRNAIQNFNKALLLLVYLFQRLEIILMYLLREEMIPAP